MSIYSRFRAWREARKRVWVVSEMACYICPKDWVSVHHKDAPRLECPDCGYMNPLPERDEPC